MRIHTALCAAGLLAASVAARAAAPAPADPQHPAIADYGAIHPRPDAAVQPRSDTHYKMIYDVVAAGDDDSRINPGLDAVARAVNVLASAGVDRAHRQLVAVIHGPATASALRDTAWRPGHNGQANPNTGLIAALRAAGVEVDVCAQALAGHGYEDEQVNPQITVALSALSTIAVYEQRGYGYEKF